MYLRPTKIKRKGRVETYWTLVRSVRRGAKVVQETVAHLGKLDDVERRQASSLARSFLGSRVDLLDLPRGDAASDFARYGRAVVDNARTLADALAARGLRIVSGESGKKLIRQGFNFCAHDLFSLL